jgi:baseplate upper protein BppU
MTVELVEGWTGDLDFVLKANGVALDLTGMTVELILRKPDGTTIDTAGDTSVPDPAAGKVRYAPDSADLVAANSPLMARWKVTNAGKVVYFPAGSPDRWEIYRP